MASTSYAVQCQVWYSIGACHRAEFKAHAFVPIAIVCPHGSMRGVADEASGIPSGIKGGRYMLAVKVGKLQPDKSPSSVNLILIILPNETQQGHLLQGSAPATKQNCRHISLEALAPLYCG